MKILTRDQFIKMPSGTLWSYYSPCVFRELNIKDSGNEECTPDFVMSQLIGAVDVQSGDEFIEKCELMEKGKSVSVDFKSTGREGLFDDKQLYAVYEDHDVTQLIDRLRLTLEKTPDKCPGKCMGCQLEWPHCDCSKEELYDN